MFIKKPLKTQKKLNKLEIMYSNAIYICISISDYNKCCEFLVKEVFEAHFLRKFFLVAKRNCVFEQSLYSEGT